MLKTLNSLGVLLFLILLCLAVGQLGTFFATEDIYQWYHLLSKPGWSPPGFIFPLAWTLSYLFMAVAAWLVWRAHTIGYRHALLFWCIQLGLNAIWTPLFFGQQEILYSLVVIDILWLFIFITTVLFYKHSRFASFLMFVYLAWVSLAGLLNFIIWRMNG